MRNLLSTDRSARIYLVAKQKRNGGVFLKGDIRVCGADAAQGSSQDLLPNSGLYGLNLQSPGDPHKAQMAGLPKLSQMTAGSQPNSGAYWDQVALASRCDPRLSLSPSFSGERP